MLQAKFSIEETQSQFLNNFKAYGFKNKSSMLRAAIEHFKKEMELKSLRKSAELYSKIYSEDDDLKELTETALNGWPECSEAIGIGRPHSFPPTQQTGPYCASRLIRKVSDKFSRTPIHKAAFKDSVRIISMLLGAGATIDAKDQAGRIPSMIDCERRYADTVRVREEITLHFQESRRPHGKARGGRIASYLTDEQRSQAGWIGASKCEVIFERALSYFLKNNADIEATDNLQWIPLFRGVFYGHYNTVSFLLRNGADKKHKDKKGLTVLDYAEEQGQEYLMKLLKPR